MPCDMRFDSAPLRSKSSRLVKNVLSGAGKAALRLLPAVLLHESVELFPTQFVAALLGVSGEPVNRPLADLDAPEHLVVRRNVVLHVLSGNLDFVFDLQPNSVLWHLASLFGSQNSIRVVKGYFPPLVPL